MKYRININYTFNLGAALENARRMMDDYTLNGAPIPQKIAALYDRLQAAENALDFGGYGRPRIKGLRAYITALHARKA